MKGDPGASQIALDTCVSSSIKPFINESFVHLRADVYDIDLWLGI